MRKNVQSPSHTSSRIGTSTSTITSTTTTCTRNLSFSVSSHCNCFSKRTRLAFCCQHRVTVSSSTYTPEHKHAACVRVEQQGSLESLWITEDARVTTKHAAVVAEHHLLLHYASPLLQRLRDLHRTAPLRARAASDGRVVVFAAAADSSCCPCSRLLFPSLLNLLAHILPTGTTLSTGTTLLSARVRARFDGRKEGRAWRHSAGSVAHASGTGFNGASYQMQLC